METKQTISEQGRQARTEYLRQWRRRNPERMRAYQMTYWERRAEKQKSEK